jgi:Insect cuticle protein
MFAKIAFIASCLAIAAAQHYDGYHGYAAPAAVYHHAAPAVYAAPIVKKFVAAAPEPYDPNPSYSFNYGVSDPHTGDSKTAEEHLENGVTHGSYSFTEADGTIRKVTYTADDHNGFNAQVERIGEPAPTIVKKVIAAPAVYAAPAYHAAAPAYYHH